MCVCVCARVQWKTFTDLSGYDLWLFFLFIFIFISFHLDWNGLCWNAPASKIIDKRSHTTSMSYRTMNVVVQWDFRWRKFRKKKNRKSKIKNVSIYISLDGHISGSCRQDYQMIVCSQHHISTWTSNNISDSYACGFGIRLGARRTGIHNWAKWNDLNWCFGSFCFTFLFRLVDGIENESSSQRLLLV